MATRSKKGTLERIVAKVEEAIHTVGVEVGLIEEPKPKTKRTRKSARKAIVQKAEQIEKAAKKAQHAAHRRAAGLNAIDDAEQPTSHPTGLIT